MRSHGSAGDSNDAADAASVETASADRPVPAWASASDEALLAMRICDLGLTIEGSELVPRIEQLYGELAERGLAIRPACYLGDEWFSPEGVVAISLPFYLAHPRLRSLELRQMLEVEGGTPEWCQMLLRHECGHAVDHAYGFSARRGWRAIFGNPQKQYAPETYQPRPYSKGFVRHLPNWYAQAHPDEDFAETFAVWLGMPEAEWRRRYAGWRALDKLIYVHSLMTEVAGKPLPAATNKTGRRISQAQKLKRTLGRYYQERRRQYAEDYPDVYDSDLRRIFNAGNPWIASNPASEGNAPSDAEHGEASKEPRESAGRFMKRNRKRIVGSLVHWTGQRKYTVDMLVAKLAKRCQELKLTVPKDEARLHLELAACLSALVTNHLHTGRFKRSV